MDSERAKGIWLIFNLSVGTKYPSLKVHIETVNRPYLGSSYQTPRGG